MKNIENAIFYLEQSIDELVDDLVINNRKAGPKDRILIKMLESLGELLEIYSKKSHLKLIWSNSEFKN